METRASYLLVGTFVLAFAAGLVVFVIWLAKFQFDTEFARFDIHFKGRVLAMYKVFAWAMEVNYRDFFGAAHSSPLGQILKMAGSKAWSGLTSTPRSGSSSSDPEETSTSPTS